MAKLYDLMAATPDIAGQGRNLLLMSTRICSQEIADIYDEDIIRSGRTEFGEFPPIRLPWQVTWLEFRWPEGPIKLGAILVELDRDGFIEATKLNHELRNLKPSDSYIMASCFCEIEQVRKVVPLGGFFIGLTSEFRHNQTAAVPIIHRCFSCDKDMPGVLLTRITGVTLKTLGVANCKNIILERQCPYDEALQKARVRRGKPPFFDYHILRIDPSKTRTKTIGGPVEHDSDPKRLHICRGHFKTYTDERPLFGRLTGTFWVPQHMRGDMDVGVVAKDYEIVAAKKGI